MKNLTTLTLAARKRGISLIEAVLYLVIALAVIVGGIVFFQQAQLSNQVTDTARAGVGISSQVRGLYQSQRDFSEEDLTAAIVASGSVPSNFIGADDSDGNPTIVHPFGGDMIVHGTNGEFAIAYTDLSLAACLRLGTVGEDGAGPLGTGIMGHRIVRNWTEATVDLASGNRGTTPPIDAAYLAENCQENASLVMYYSR